MIKHGNYNYHDNYLNRKIVITTMSVITWIKKLFSKQEETSSVLQESIYKQEEEIEEIHSVWDYINLIENTQAAHISAVVGFDEWVAMGEILRRIKEIFRIEYKNDRSLYPYIKTLVDVGLLETSNVGGRKKWRKKDVLIKIKGKNKEETVKETVKKYSN